MNTEEKLPEMPEEVRAYCERLRACINRLTRDLDDSRKATESVQANAEVERSELKAQLSVTSLRVKFLTELAKESREQLKREAARVLEVARSLRRLLNAVHPRNSPNITPGEVEEIRAACRDAAEVLALVEVPFG